MQESFVQSVGPARYSDIGLLKDHPNYSARKFAESVGITPKAIEKHLAKLVSKHSPSCYGILLAELTDTSIFHVQWLDLIFRTNVASHVLQAAEEDSLLFTEGQRLHLDSTVLFGSGLNHLDRLPSATRLFGKDGTMKEFDDPERADRQTEDSYSAQAAILTWRDEAFTSALESFRDYELSQGMQNHSIMRMLMRTVILRSSKIETFLFAKQAQEHQPHRCVEDRCLCAKGRNRA